MPDPIIYDRNGDIRTIEWAREKYGPFVIYPAPAGDSALWRLTALREKNDSTFIAAAKGPKGEPALGTRICFYWPDAPTLINAGPLGVPFDGISPNQAVSGYANASGQVGFGMGAGATYHAENGERGPHAAWICGANTRSDVLLGIGMIPDDHLHLDATWTMIEEDPEEPPSPEGLVAALLALAQAMNAVADEIGALARE